MEENLNKYKDLRNQQINFYKENKKKIFTILLFILIISVSAIFFNTQSKQNNSLIAEKYIQAGIFLSLEENEKSKKIYEEIIKSKNKFYSSLALFALIEKKLEKENSKVLEYFTLVEKVSSSEENKDLLKLKKALFLIKISKNEEGKEILQGLINKKSHLTKIAQEILNK
tara:strand:- start:11 stop:520 length:510 start_codon:yes stop_codon:yes gene_type:complete